MPVIMKDNVQYAYTTKGTVFHTLSNAEYEALTEEEKMNGDVYCIPDREPVINPDQLWEKVGTGTLDIGDDLTDGVNQLNSSLDNKQDKLENGKDILLGGVSSSNVSTTTFTNINISSIEPYSLLHFNTSYYTAGRPNYGGITLSVAQLRRFISEAFFVNRYDNAWSFSIKYVNDTTLAVKFAGTQSVNNCLSIHAIL